jgi:hypothetical protein
VAANDNGRSSPPVDPTGPVGPTTPPVNPTPPPAGGWEIPREQAEQAADAFGDLSELLHEVVPEDLQKRIAEAIRELLVALRALLDWLVERLERRPGGAGGAAEVRDIPIL